MAAASLGTIPTFNHNCQGCPEIIITHGTQGAYEVLMDISAAADGVGITYKGCHPQKKRKKVPVILENLETTCDDGTLEQNPLDPCCWLNKSYKDPRGAEQDFGPNLSAYDQLTKDLTDSACADVFGTGQNEDSFGNKSASCKAYLGPITVTGSGNITMTYVKKGGADGTSCGNIGTINMPLISTRTAPKSSSADFTIPLEVKALRATTSGLQQLQVCTPGQYLQSGRVVAKDSGKKIDFPKYINITCEKRPKTNDGGGVSLSRTVGGAVSNPTLNASGIKEIAEKKIRFLADEIMTDFMLSYNKAYDLAQADACGAVLSCSVSCSFTVS